MGNIQDMTKETLQRFEYCNKHYIRVSSTGCITNGWSDGPFNHREPSEDDILINDKGGYQFRLVFEDGSLSEENPALFDAAYNIPLYRWTGEHVVVRTREEIDADIEVRRRETEKRAHIADLHRFLNETDWIVVRLNEAELYHPDEVDELKAKYADRIKLREDARAELDALEG